MNPLIKKLILVGAIAGTIGGIFNMILFLVIKVRVGNPYLEAAAKTISMDLGLGAFIITLTLLYVKLGRSQSVLHLWEGLVLGFSAGLLFGIIGATSSSLYVIYNEPELLEEYKLSAIKALEKNQAYLIEKKDSLALDWGEEQYDQQITFVTNQIRLTPDIDIWTMWQDEFFKKLLFSSIITLLLSLILRKHAKTINDGK